MRAIILYHPKDEFERQVTEYQRDYTRSHSHEIKLVSLETLDGAATGELYGVTRYPALMVMAEDGQLQKIWQGMPMPLMAELDGYLGA